MHLSNITLLVIGLMSLLINSCASTYSPLRDTKAYVEEDSVKTPLKPQAPDLVEMHGDSLPCWVENSKCNQLPGYAYFTGSIKKTGAWSKRNLRRAAVQDAISQLAEYFETVIESKIWQKTICGYNRCEHEAGKRVVASAVLGIRGQDFERVDEYIDHEWLHVRVRIPRVFLEDRLNRVVRNP